MIVKVWHVGGPQGETRIPDVIRIYRISVADVMAVNIDISPGITNVKSVETPKERVIVCRRFHANPEFQSVYFSLDQCPDIFILLPYHTLMSNHVPKSNSKNPFKSTIRVCVLIPPLFTYPAQPVLLVSVLGHWNLFVPLAETEEEGR